MPEQAPQRNYRTAVAAGTLLAAELCGRPGAALAHTSESAIVLTLPRDLYIFGGSLVVGISFVLVALVGTSGFARLEAAVRPLGRLPRVAATPLSLASFFVMLALIGAGLLGTPDPLANPLPLTIWTLWWVGLTVLHLVFGNLWAVLNPWRGLYALIGRLPGPARWVAAPPLRYPDWLGTWPAVLQFLGFAWFELVYTAPQDPPTLARALGLYFLANLAAMLLFGDRAWLRQGEAFSVYFRVVSWMSPLNGRPEAAPGGADTGRLQLTLPGLGLLRVAPLSLSAVAFVILMLSTVSFDGLSLTFRWLGTIGINPLEFPGRSAVLLPNSLGLLATFGALLCCYLGVVWLGHRLAGRPTKLTEAFGGYALSVVPIAFGYHLAHYLTIFMVDVQHAAIAFNDPLGLGWNLLGLRGAHVTASFLMDYHAVGLIWRTQIAIIVVAHVVAVALAHAIALRQVGARGRAVVSQIPMTVLMICYTLFGLWLLSAPVAG
ncbi:MAG: hypothetical protein QNJ30_15210 [Kiloniellales bacterium]|nr:hypothetical protein [Kiloniellales bacterium]